MKRAPLAAAIALALALVVPEIAGATHWRVEGDLRDEPLSFNRQTFIFDPGRFTMLPREAYVRSDFVAFYTRHGFDRNYLTWAPSAQVNPDGYDWTGCDVPPGHPTGTFCPDHAIHTRPVRDNVPIGTLTAIAWGGSFISNVCGNWSTAGSKDGPIPRLEGRKFDDRNRDGVRNAGETGLAGWTMRLLYNGNEVARTTTGVDGSYGFSLNANSLPVGAGSYRVVEVQQPGWVGTSAPGAVDVGLGAGEARIGGLDFGNRRDLAPAIVVSKSAIPEALDEPGGLAEYVVSVRNVSADPDDVITVDSISDDQYADLSECAAGAVIAVGTTWVCRFQGDVRGNAGEAVTDTIQVVVRDRDGRTAADEASASVVLRDVLPLLRVTKSPGVEAVREPGAQVSFRVVVTNASPSATDPVRITSLTDDVYGSLDGRGTCAIGALLAAGETYACEFTALVTGEGATTHTNVMAAAGVDDEANGVVASAVAHVRVEDVLPSIRVSKVADPLLIPATGADVGFTIRVTNAGVEPVLVTSLSDDVFGDLVGRGTCQVGAVIQVDGSYECSFSVFLEGVPWLDHRNLTTVRAEDNERNVVEMSDEALVDLIVPSGNVCKITGGGKIDIGDGAIGQFGNNVHTPPDVRVFFDHRGGAGFLLESRQLDSVVCSDDHRAASIFGTGTIDGGRTYAFRIDVVDAGEPPFADTYRIRIENGYDSGVRTRTEGNIQIHR